MREIGRGENGVVFVTGKVNKYLVIYSYDDEIGEPEITTGREIFQTMEMDDCYPVHIEKLLLIDGKEIHECKFYDTWCCTDRETGKIDPLRMEIRRMADGILLDSGYAPEH